MQAAMPMYFPPQAALQAFWAALATLLRADPRMVAADIPEVLTQAADCHVQWLEPDLLLSQACGYPLVTQLAGRVQLVGTFAYDAPGAEGTDCRSQLICRASDPRSSLEAFAGSTLAFNDTISQSGYNALRALVSRSATPRPFFAHTVMTGAHYRSIEAVRSGQADMAAVDAVSWALWQQDQQRDQTGRAAELRVFGQTDTYPGLPLITSLQTASEVLAALRQALQRIASDPAFAAVRAPLRITGFKATTPADYQRCLDMQALAFAAGLHTL
ncbi:phosphate/phosphite/phosphonate ABC transporter substrate-binding protein [Rhodoferax lacus]|nr:PhnD/SsuA/transferrin family substrate-binding protein [Rhodoferax lacus]